MNLTTDLCNPTIEERDFPLAPPPPPRPIACGPPPPPPPPIPVAPTLRLRPETLTAALRWLGAITLMTAGTCYLVGSWMEAAPLTRFYTFFCFTVFLGCAGVFCGVRWHEDKGARTFLGLSALFVPSCAAQLAALIYAQIYGASTLPGHLQILRFEPVGPLGLTLACGLAVVFLGPLMFLSFSALARPEARRLTWVYLVANTALLLPSRAPDVTAWIAIVLLAFQVTMDRCRFSRAPGLKHWDGTAMRLALFLPLVLMIGRTLLLYGSSSLLNSVLLTIAGGVLFLLLPACTTLPGLQSASRVISVVPITAAWLNLVDPIVRLSTRPEEMVLQIGVLPAMAIIAWLSLHAGEVASLFRRGAAFVAMAITLFDLLFLGGVTASVLCVAVAVVLVAGAFWLEDRFLLGLGAAGFSICILNMIYNARDFWAQNLWVSLAILGVAILLSSSIIERNWQRIRKRGKALLAEWHSWS